MLNMRGIGGVCRETLKMPQNGGFVGCEVSFFFFFFEYFYFWLLRDEGREKMPTFAAVK